MSHLFEIKVKEGYVRKWAHHARTLFKEGEPCLDFHTAVFGQREFEVKSLQEFALLEEKKVRAFLLKKLSERNYCSQELAKILKKYLVREELISSLIEEFVGLGFINDRDFMESVIRSGQARKLGAEWILQKLKNKGVSEEIAREVIGLKDSFEERVLRIKSLLVTKYKKKDLTEFKERQKVAASLVRKGYSFEEIKAALSGNNK